MTRPTDHEKQSKVINEIYGDGDYTLHGATNLGPGHYVVLDTNR